MLCLERKSTNRLAVCEALLRRAILSKDEEEQIRQQLWRISAGMNGEMRSDRFWEELQLKESYRLFHNVEVQNHFGYQHQMDTVFVCSKFALIIELKHIAGEIAYDAERHQLLKMHNGKLQAFGDPFNQVTRHAEWMEQFLWELGIRHIPVISAVIVTTTSSVLRNMPKSLPMFKLEGLRFKLNEWFSQYEEVISVDVLDYICEELLARHCTKKWKPPMENVTLKKGVLCIGCGQKMTYHYGVFSCKCGGRCRDGFLRGLEDYRLLVDDWITNRAFRQFFAIDNPKMVQKILLRLQLRSVGERKTRKYFIPEDILTYKMYRREVNWRKNSSSGE